MSILPDKMLAKLEKVATVVESEKGPLHFFGLVHLVNPPDRWDLLVSSDKLVPWSFESLTYLVERLQKVLTTKEMVQIAQIVALPLDHKVIAGLMQNDRTRFDGILYHDDRFDAAVVLRPKKPAIAEARTA